MPLFSFVYIAVIQSLSLSYLIFAPKFSQTFEPLARARLQTCTEPSWIYY